MNNRIPTREPLLRLKGGLIIVEGRRSYACRASSRFCHGNRPSLRSGGKFPVPVSRDNGKTAAA